MTRQPCAACRWICSPRLENGKGGVGSDKLLAVLDGLGLAMVIAPKQDALMARLPRA